jgi:hypothetical protein
MGTSIENKSRDFVNTKGSDLLLSQIPGGQQVIEEIKKVGIQFDKLDENFENKLIAESLRNNANFEKARKAFSGLPGSIVLIIFIIVFILTLIILNVTGAVYGWIGYTKNIKYGIKNYDELRVQDGSNIGTLIEGDDELNIASLISLLIGIIGVVYALVLVGVFIARFILKPRTKNAVASAVEGIDAILGSRTVELLLLIPCIILFLYFIGWIVINVISYLTTGSEIKKIKDKYKDLTPVLDSEERKKLQSARQARFAIPSIASFIAGFYPIILSIVIIVYLIVTRIRIKETLRKVGELSPYSVLLKAGSGAIQGALAKKYV